MMAPKTFLMIVLVAFGCLFFATNAWTDYGHIMSAEIARRNLSEKRVEELNKIAGTFNPYFQGRDITKFPYLAIFMDAIKSDTILFDPMHYIDFPYQTGGDFVAPEPGEVNALYAMTQAISNLVFTSNRQHSVWSKSISLLLFVHVLGDIHQPLHAVSLFDADHAPPQGDKGGNLWFIDYTAETDGHHYTQLHLLFDAVGGLWLGSLPTPVTSAFDDNIATLVDSVMTQFPASDFEDKLNFDFNTPDEFHELVTSWALESFELAKVAYDQYKLNSKIDQQQIQWARSMLKQRIALAGYRMAKVLDKIDTTILNDPDRNTIPAVWRALAIVATVAAIAALVGFVMAFRKYKDYKQLAALQPDESKYSPLNTEPV